MFRAFSAIRSLVFPAAVGLIICLAAGTWRLPFVWGVLGVLAFFAVTIATTADPDLVRERRSPESADRDRLTHRLSFVLMPVHWVLVGLDIGRFHWSPVVFELQISGLIGYVVAITGIFCTMRVNRFYSSAVRVQSNRGHAVVTSGPYRIVRHPGYTASLTAFLCGGLALGSWVAMIPIAAIMALFIRRTLLEDALLKAELPGYAEYVKQVKFRLIPRIF